MPVLNTALPFLWAMNCARALWQRFLDLFFQKMKSNLKGFERDRLWGLSLARLEGWAKLRHNIGIYKEFL